MTHPPTPAGGNPGRIAAAYRRARYFVVMQSRKQ